MQKTYKSWLKQFHQSKQIDENVYTVCNHILSNISNDYERLQPKTSDFKRLYDFYQFVSKRPKLLSILTYDLLFDIANDYGLVYSSGLNEYNLNGLIINEEEEYIKNPRLEKRPEDIQHFPLTYEGFIVAFADIQHYKWAETRKNQFYKPIYAEICRRQRDIADKGTKSEYHPIHKKKTKEVVDIKTLSKSQICIYGGAGRINDIIKVIEANNEKMDSRITSKQLMYFYDLNYISFDGQQWVFSEKNDLHELVDVPQLKEFIDYISETENKGATLVETDYSDILEVHLSETNLPDYPYSQKRINNHESLQDRQRAKKKMEKEKKREDHKQRIAKQSKLEQKMDNVDLNNSQILSVFNFLWSQTVIWAFYGAIYLFESCSKDFMHGELLSIFVKVSLLALLTSTIGFVLSSKKKTHPTTRSMSNGWSEMFYFFFTVLILIVATFCCVFVAKLVFAPSHISSVQNEIKPYCYTIIGMFLMSRMYFDAD